MELTIAEYTAEHGGGTFEAGTLLPFAPDHGYAVAISHGTAAFVTLDGDLTATAKRVAQEFEASFVGTWQDGDRVHVDPVTYIVDRYRAIAVGKAYGQEAIYDFGTGDVISLVD